MTVKLCMNNKVKEYCNSQDVSVSKDFYEAYNNKCKKLLDEACERAKANTRKTVLTRDL